MYSSREVQQPRCIFAYLPEVDLELAVSRDNSQSRETSTVIDEALQPVVPGGSRDISCLEPHVGESRMGRVGCRSLETLLRLLALFILGYTFWQSGGEDGVFLLLAPRPLCCLPAQ
jgi:hypothetical protein